MDEDTLITTSDTELEKLFDEVDPELLEKAVTEDTSAVSEPKGDQEDPKEDPKSKSGDLNVALRQEREKTQREREQRIALEAKLAALEPYLNKSNDQEDSQEEPDPYIETPEFVRFETNKARAEMQAELDRMQGELIKNRVAMDEALLERSGELEEYQELVNLRDPEHFFYKYVQATPGLMDKVWSSARPAKTALEYAKNAKRIMDPDYANSERDKIKAEAKKEALQEILQKVKSKSANAKGPVGISDLSSATGKDKTTTANVSKMSYEELEKAIYEED